MNVIETRAKIMDEIAGLPDDKLNAIYVLLRAFRSSSAEVKSKNRRLVLAKKLYGSASRKNKPSPNDFEIGRILDEARGERFGDM